MLKRSLRQFFLLVFVGGLPAPYQLRAEEFSIVLDPGTRLTADQELFAQDRRGSRDAFSNYSIADPAVVSGKSAKDAADAKSFILQLEKPRTAGYSDVQEGIPEGGKEYKDFPYKGVHVVQPFSLWHRAAPGAAPVLLGRAFTWNEASQLEEELRPEGPHRKFRIINRSTDEMIRMAIEEKLEELPSLLVDAWSPNVIHQTPRLNVTPEKVLELLRQSLSNTSTVAGSSLQVMTTYAPSRVVKNPDGGVVVEVDLWNRLPVRAYGEITCRQARIAYPAGFLTVEEMKRIRERNEARRHFVTCKFDLAPGQKDVARFVIPPEAGTDPQLFLDDEIRVDGGSSGLGTPGKDRPKLRRGERQRRK